MPPPNELTRFPNGEYVLPVIEASTAPSITAAPPPAMPAPAAATPPPAAIVVTAATPAAAPADPATTAVVVSACPTCAPVAIAFCMMIGAAIVLEMSQRASAPRPNQFCSPEPALPPTPPKRRKL